MGLALQTIGCFATNPGAGGAAFAALGGDSLTILNFADSSSAQLVTVWGANATGGIAKIKSPKLHDNVNGIEVNVPAASNRRLLDPMFPQKVYSQDTLSVNAAGGGAESDALFLSIFYDDIGGLNARLATPQAIQPRVLDLVGITVTQTAGTAIGNWSGGAKLNSTDDQMRANQDYAILGYTTATEGGALGIQGPDTGNVKVGGPLTTDAIETRKWFVELSERLGKGCIPIVNAANKGATSVFTAQAVAGTAVTTVLHCALLSP